MFESPACRIKAFTPVSVLLVSAAFRLKELNARILCIVGVISLGVTIASYGEIVNVLLYSRKRVSTARRIANVPTTPDVSIPFQMYRKISMRRSWKIV